MTDTPASRPSSVDRATRHGDETRAGWLTSGAEIAVVVDAIGIGSAPSPARQAPLGTGSAPSPARWAPLGTGSAPSPARGARVGTESAPSRVGTASIHAITTLHH